MTKELFVIMCIITLLFFPVSVKLLQMHPNENVYFNWLIGGLKGAQQRNIPAWGVSYGNAYVQGIHWLNAHAEKNASFTLVSGGLINLPYTEIRSDITFSNDLWSGSQRHGEYIMDMTYQGFPDLYKWEYVNRFLTPVYEDNVDGVSILKIWKNDNEHTKEDYLHEDSNTRVTESKRENNWITLTLSKKMYLTKLDETYNNTTCSPLKNGYILIS